MKIIINPTWRCQYKCPYCWVRAMGWHRRTKELPWERWAEWLQSLPWPSVVDFSGGEPLLYPGMIDLLQACGDTDVAWAITTNLENKEAWSAMVSQVIPGCVLINVSAHPQSPADLPARVHGLLAAGYPVRSNIVDHLNAPLMPDLCVPVNLLPYQDWENDLATDDVARICNAGVRHIACDPKGNFYRCLVAMQKGQEPLGNITKNVLEHSLPIGAQPCDFGCSTCYRDAPGGWMVSMEPR